MGGRKAYLITSINSRKRALKFGDLLISTSAAQQIVVVAIFYESRIVITSCELICVRTQQRLLARQEVAAAALKTWGAGRLCLCC